MIKKGFLIFGLILLALFVVACASGETVVGQAVKQDKSCLTMENRCGFVTKDAAQKLTLIGFNEIKKFYTNGDFQLGKPAEDICDELGCGGCFAGQIEGMTTYYESTGNVCSNPQTYTSNSELVSCDVYGFSSGPCDTTTMLVVKEPAFGDFQYQRHLDSVICSGCPANLVKDLKALPWPEDGKPEGSPSGGSGGGGGKP